MAITTETESSESAVVTACKKHWEANKGDCSGFVKAVAAELGITLTGQANSIVDAMATSPWTALADGAEAQSKAATGNFVLGGLKATANGHVVVVVPGTLNRGKYPPAYWGKLNGVGKENTTINWSWNETDRDKVTYAYYSTKTW